MDYVEVKSGRVIYGGGAKGRIIGKETLNVDGLPELHNVLQVLGLLTIATNWENVIIVEVPGSKHIKNLMGLSEKLSKDDIANGVDNTMCYIIIDSLLYLTATCPDNTLELGLWYTQDTNTNLVGFSDADWAGDLDDRKNTSGECFYLRNNLVSWYSKKQNCVSLSTSESEYVVAASCCSQLV
ncbi:uncharacterized protein LOC142505507 [Primulina tabacum]|uniref:uncharacterized protein LOC142505507 n=1 Tax=Primulina tabacum TaxID=48773 RepID=UPI003F593895